MKITIHKDKLNQLVHSRNALIILVIILVIIVSLFFLNTINAGKLNRGLKIANVSVSGLTSEQAIELLKEDSKSFLKKEIFLNYKDSYYQTDLQKLGVEIDIPSTVNYAFSKNNIFWQIKSLFKYNIEPSWVISEEKLENYLLNNLSSIHQPAKNSTLIYAESDFTTTSSSEGVIINKEKLKKEIEKNIKEFEQNNIKLSLIKDFPEVLENETEKAKNQAKELLENAPIKIMVEDTEADTITKEKLLDLISFIPINGILGIEFKEETIKDYLIVLSPLVNHEPIDAQLTIKNDKVTTFALSKQGISLEIKDNIKILSEKLFTEKEIELKIKTIQPKITTDSINNMGITALLAKGVSDFSGSPNNRIHNIKIGAAKFNGILIKSDEEFSFNDILGEVGPEQGYLPELVIKREKTVPEYGGGLCQVSTTTFRAAINSGLEITQRYPHAFPVKYYDPQGFDATIYPPFPDLKFINNTPNNILIQTRIKEYNLIFEFYGTDDKRLVEIDGPHQYEIKEDGSMKASLIQKVYDKKGSVLINKTFYSDYKSPDLYPVEKNPLE